MQLFKIIKKYNKVYILESGMILVHLNGLTNRIPADGHAAKSRGEKKTLGEKSPSQ